MIRFRDVTTADKDLIQQFTLYGERQNCDLSFANIISWRFNYNTQFAIVDDYLVFRFYIGRHLAYMMPIPRPKEREDGTLKVVPCDECSVNVIRTIRNDATAMGHPFLMMGVCNYMVDLIEQAFPDTFDMKPDRDFADYIYTREKLINLSGKKLQSKRNHINKFKSLYPNYEYKPLTPELIPECLKLEQEWRQVSKGDNAQDEELSGELRSMTRAFNRWERLGLSGGTIFVENKLVAFTYGCPINQSTFDVCVEKADVSYEGAFTIINQEFVKHLPSQYIYINREEDMGEEGLRRAKLSYKPDILLEKNVVMERHPLASFEDQERIKNETRDLWRLVFKDPEPFIELYFNRVYTGESNYTCQINGRVVAALQALPYTLLYYGNEVKTVYISGVSTHPDMRNQDIGNNLMKQVHFNLYHKEVIFSALIPAEPWLYGWYAKCGYAERITCTPPPEGVEGMSFAEFDAWQRQKTCILLHDETGYDIIQEDLRLHLEPSSSANQPIQGMIRVINARAALELYAVHHPSTACLLRVTDDRDIPLNNAYYIISKGHVQQTDEPFADAKRLTIGQLADFLFADKQAEMNLMLN